MSTNNNNSISETQVCDYLRDYFIRDIKKVFEIYNNAKINDSVNTNLYKKGYFFPLVIKDCTLYIAFQLGSTKNSSYIMKPIGGDIKEDEFLKDGLLRKINEGTCGIVNTVAKVTEDKIIYDDSFFNSPAFTKEGEILPSSVLFEEGKTIKTIECVKLLNCKDIDKINFTQVEILNYADLTDEDKLPVPSEFLESRGIVLIPFESFFDLLGDIEKRTGKEKYNTLFTGELTHLYPNNKSRFETIEEFRTARGMVIRAGHGDDVVIIPKELLDYLKDKKQFFEDAVKNLNLKQ